jgi:hypothetical protein
MTTDSVFVITVVGSAMGILLGMGAIVITLFIYSQGKMDAALKAIQDEMKDFHTRLALQDQEFKSRLCAIEERRKG